MTQIRIALSVYVLVAIVRKRLRLDRSLYTILQILSLSLFEKTPVIQVLSQESCNFSPMTEKVCFIFSCRSFIPHSAFGIPYCIPIAMAVESTVG
jgi:hypothetical protein